MFSDFHFIENIYTFYLNLKICILISACHGGCDGHVGSAGRGGTAGLDGRGGHPCIFQLAPSQADSVGHVVV